MAVVSLLKELGASKTLSTLIEGESLVNDGSAMVLFEVILTACEGKAVTFGNNLIIYDNRYKGSVVKQFCQLSLGGIAMGLAFAIVSSFWIGRIFRKPLIEMQIIFITPYLVIFIFLFINPNQKLFFTNENSGIGFSGVLGLVTCGVFMSGFGKTKISPESEH